jgi:hypothetical protein
MKPTTLNIALSQTNASNDLPENVGRHVEQVDTALLGKHI